MKKLLLSIVSIPFLLGASVASAGVEGSPHDLSGRAGHAAENNGEICVYCHTPHAANVAFTGAPIWNKPSPTNTVFEMYGTTIAGTATETAPAAASLACLTCHDGASAINAVVNAPGSGPGDGLIGTLEERTAGISAIGLDGLTNDHPISIEYVAGRAGLKPLTTEISTWGSYTTIQDLMRGPTNNRVECGSCHNPHSTDYDMFLRASNVASALCLTCHDK